MPGHLTPAPHPHVRATAGRPGSGGSGARRTHTSQGRAGTRPKGKLLPKRLSHPLEGTWSQGATLLWAVCSPLPVLPWQRHGCGGVSHTSEVTNCSIAPGTLPGLSPWPLAAGPQPRPPPRMSHDPVGKHVSQRVRPRAPGRRRLPLPPAEPTRPRGHPVHLRVLLPPPPCTLRSQLPGVRGFLSFPALRLVPASTVLATRTLPFCTPHSLGHPGALVSQLPPQPNSAAQDTRLAPQSAEGGLG